MHIHYLSKIWGQVNSFFYLVFIQQGYVNLMAVKTFIMFENIFVSKYCSVELSIH